MEYSNRSPLLSICICAIPSREQMCKDLRDFLMHQIHSVGNKHKLYGVAEILTIMNLNQNIGEKRNDLLKMANGKFIVFIDDDDMVADDYVEQIIHAIHENPDCDCIGIKGIITFDGTNEKKWQISKDFGSWFEDNMMYYRTPNHISPIRTSIAQSIGFPNISNGEDFEFSMKILPHLKTEVKIDKELYHYRYISNK